jgi:hypothetical protein
MTDTLKKQFENICKNEAAWLVTAILESKERVGSCEPVYNVINRIIAESSDPAITKAFYGFLMDGIMAATENKAA